MKGWQQAIKLWAPHTSAPHSDRQWRVSPGCWTHPFHCIIHRGVIGSQRNNRPTIASGDNTVCPIYYLWCPVTNSKHRRGSCLRVSGLAASIHACVVRQSEFSWPQLTVFPLSIIMNFGAKRIWSEYRKRSILSQDVGFLHLHSLRFAFE